MVKATQIPMKPPTDDKISKQMMLRIATTTESYHNKVVLNIYAIYHKSLIKWKKILTMEKVEYAKSDAPKLTPSNTNAK